MLFGVWFKGWDRGVLLMDFAFFLPPSFFSPKNKLNLTDYPSLFFGFEALIRVPESYNGLC